MTARIIMDIIGPPLFIGGIFGACGGQSVEAKQAEADSAYAVALLACTDDAGTLAESKACRARVDTQWGVRKSAPTIPPAMLAKPDGGAQ